MTTHAKALAYAACKRYYYLAGLQLQDMGAELLFLTALEGAAAAMLEACMLVLAWPKQRLQLT